MTELNRPQLSVSGPSLAPHQTGQAVLPHPAFRGSFVASLHSGFAIERTLQLPNLEWGCYPPEESLPSRAAMSRSRAVRARIDPSAPPSLRGGCGLRRIDATTRDSDFSRRPARLGGIAPLDGWLGRCRPTARDLPAYLGRPSCRVALADPAGINDAHVTIVGRRVAAFAVPTAARLTGCRIFEAHQMRFTFVATRQFHRRPACGSASRPHPGHRVSVVNRLTRPVGLAPTW